MCTRFPTLQAKHDWPSLRTQHRTIRKEAVTGAQDISQLAQKLHWPSPIHTHHTFSNVAWAEVHMKLTTYFSHATHVLLLLRRIALCNCCIATFITAFFLSINEASSTCWPVQISKSVRNRNRIRRHKNIVPVLSPSLCKRAIASAFTSTSTQYISMSICNRSITSAATKSRAYRS